MCGATLAGNTANRIAYTRPTALSEEKRWVPYYQHYYDYRLTLYAETVLVKIDDDIVFLDVDTFADYIQYVVDHPQPFLTFPNIVNNGAAAHLQQTQQRILPVEKLGVFELPGYGGSLWESQLKSAKLHHFFFAGSPPFLT